MTSLHGKTAFVTGAASGIGRASAIQLARHGANVCLVDIQEEGLNQVKEELERLKCNVITVTADVTDRVSMKSAFHQFQQWGKQLDILFSNAGVVGLLTPIEDMPEEEWDRIMTVNVKGAFLTVKYAIPFMKDNGGCIIVTSSIHGNRIFNSYGMSVYSTSKAALTAFAKTAALELARYKIRVNVISPGAVETGLNDHLVRSDELSKVIIPVEYPEGKYPFGIGHAVQIADLVTFLASEQAAYISGTEIYIDGARSLI
ncbi:SDR family oxidoreductase [Paenibacillus sp. JMULE4]|uniref:SDR family NAD(P)-dependent oxidoreductase n=1 Tax=Paenibacillus TaxID=44249 RepID=UPI0015766502|nr:SDR family NAD(P)-dependent oxidoreductase [Paenibacillus sp. JMULE4]NTZ16592.1 SDR family oxidoreductase [Paenibacillus sp. JMULE4]